MNLFSASDRPQLTAPPRLFDRAALEEEHGDWGHQLLRAAVALEMLTQITRQDQHVLLKGGTLRKVREKAPSFRAGMNPTDS